MKRRLRMAGRIAAHSRITAACSPCAKTCCPVVIGQRWNASKRTRCSVASAWTSACCRAADAPYGEQVTSTVLSFIAMALSAPVMPGATRDVRSVVVATTTDNTYERPAADEKLLRFTKPACWSSCSKNEMS